MSNYRRYYSGRARIMQERRVSPKNSKWCRARRNVNNLKWFDARYPNDIEYKKKVPKSWKAKRNKKYYANGRGERQEFYIAKLPCEYEYQFPSIIAVAIDYLEQYAIPYRVEWDYSAYSAYSPCYRRARKYSNLVGCLIVVWSFHNIVLPLDRAC